MHVSRAPSFKILQHLWKPCINVECQSFWYLVDLDESPIERELFNLDLVEQPLLSSKNNVKSEEDSRLGGKYSHSRCEPLGGILEPLRCWFDCPVPGQLSCPLSPSPPKPTCPACVRFHSTYTRPHPCLADQSRSHCNLCQSHICLAD